MLSLCQVCPDGATDYSDLPSYYDIRNAGQCVPTSYTAECGQKYLCFLDCSVGGNPDDPLGPFNPLDPASVAAYAAAGRVFLTPPGTITTSYSQGDDIVLDGCGKTEPGDQLHDYAFSTPQLDPNLLDSKWWKKFGSVFSSLRVILIECTDVYTLQDDWVDWIDAGGVATAPAPQTSPGFEFSLITAPHKEPNTTTNKCEWVMGIQIKRQSTFCQAFLPGFATAVGAV